ncbi:MAG: hypothetical protein ACYCZB_03040 [Acidiphilium sp.]
MHPATEQHTSNRPVSTTLGTVSAVIARQVAELHALAASPGERAIVARIATQAIERGLSGEAAR